MSRAGSLARAFGADGTLNTSDVSGLGALAALNTVGTNQIDDSAITNAKLAADGLDASKLTTGTLPNARLASGAAVANLGYTPVNKAGDTMSGALNMTSLNVTAGSQRQIRTWDWSTTLAQNTRYNLMYNNSAYTDVHFIFTLEGFHGSRSYVIYAGVFGGYGASFTNIGNGYTAIVPSVQDIDPGRKYFGVDVLSLPEGAPAECYFHMTIFGDAPITLVNGAWV